MRNEERVAVEEAVFIVPRLEILFALVGQVNVVLDFQVFLLRRNEKVGDDVVAFGGFVVQPDMPFLVFGFPVVEQVHIPLDDVSRVCKLLVNAFLADGRVPLVVF